MITGLLRASGLYLGEESNLLDPDRSNVAGFHEHTKFIEINDEILTTLGGGWDFPPLVEPSWPKSARLGALRSKAISLVSTFDAFSDWGWKDPRNSLTLPFWLDIIPDLKVIHCVRDPREVACSLRHRNYFSVAHSMSLWKEYNERVLTHVSTGQRLITHYAAYFSSAANELARILRFMEMSYPPDILIRACHSVLPKLRHHHTGLPGPTVLQVSEGVSKLYEVMCEAAGFSQPQFAPTSSVPLDHLPSRDQVIGQRSCGALSTGASISLVATDTQHAGANLFELANRQSSCDPNTEHFVSFPLNQSELISRLQSQRVRGARYFIVPKIIHRFVHQATNFLRYLDASYPRVAGGPDQCIFDLGTVPDHACTAVYTTHSDAAPTTQPLDYDGISPCDLTGQVDAREGSMNNQKVGVSTMSKGRSGISVLVMGIYLANHPNTVSSIVPALAETTVYKLTQRWIGIGGDPPSSDVAGVTVSRLPDKAPKYSLLNSLLQSVDVAEYDHVIIADDDITLPPSFLDTFLTLQRRLGFSIAQPARTSTSEIDHPIVEQQMGVLARQTRFVEIGPLVSFSASVYSLIFPFDTTSSMGWGYENVWSYQLQQCGLSMGIIDAAPIEHSMRRRGEYYSSSNALAERDTFLSQHAHLSDEECYRVLSVFLKEGDL
jgi:hypothetical protein